MEGIDPFDGIHPPFEAFYIDCLHWHTASAARSITIVGEWLERMRRDDERALELPKDELFGHLQNIIHQSAAVSRYFWPSTGTTQPPHARRARRLRCAFGIADGNALASRDLRNAIEHFDERLDRYLAQERIGIFVPSYVGTVEEASEVPTHIFKAFYIQPLVFVLLGERFEMSPIVDEMSRLHAALEKCQSAGYRLPYVADEDRTGSGDT